MKKLRTTPDRHRTELFKPGFKPLYRIELSSLLAFSDLLAHTTSNLRVRGSSPLERATSNRLQPTKVNISQCNDLNASSLHLISFHDFIPDRHRTAFFEPSHGLSSLWKCASHFVHSISYQSSSKAVLGEPQINAWAQRELVGPGARPSCSFNSYQFQLVGGSDASWPLDCIFGSNGGTHGNGDSHCWQMG